MTSPTQRDADAVDRPAVHEHVDAMRLDFVRRAGDGTSGSRSLRELDPGICVALAQVGGWRIVNSESRR